MKKLIFALLLVMAFGASLNAQAIRIDGAISLNYVCINTSTNALGCSGPATSDLAIQIMAASTIATSTITNATCATSGVTCTARGTSAINIALTAPFINTAGIFDFVVSKPNHYPMPREYQIDEQASYDLTVDGNVYDGAAGNAAILSAVNASTSTIAALLPAALTADGLMASDAVRINGILTTSVTVINTYLGTTQPLNFTLTGASALAKVDVIDWISTAAASPNTAGVPLVDVGRINNLVTTGVTVVSPNQGTTQPINFTGTGATAMVKVDAQMILGSVINTSTAQIGVNAVAWVGTAIAAPDTAGYPKVTVKDGTGTGEIDTVAGGVAHVVLTDTATGVTNNVGGNVLGNVNGTTGGMTATGIANTFFLTNSTKVYGDAIAGSPIYELIAANTGGISSNIMLLTSGTADSGTTTTMVDAARTEAATDYWKGDTICFTNNTGATIQNQCRYIEAFTPGTDTITFAPAVTAAVATNNYSIVVNANNMDVLLANHNGAGTVGAGINAFSAVGDPLASAVPAAYSVGTAGYNLGNFLNASVSSRSSQTSVDNLQTSVTNVQTGMTSVLSRLPTALTGAGLMASDATRIGGTVQTGRDLGTSVLLSNGTGTGQVKLSGGYTSPNFSDVNGTLGSSAFAASAVTLFQAGLISLPKAVALPGFAVFAHRTGQAPNVGVTGATMACTRSINNGAGFGAFSGGGLTGAAEVGLGNYSINFDNTVVGNITIINCTFTGGSGAADIFQQYIYSQHN